MSDQARDSRLNELCDGVLESDDGDTFPIHKIVLARKSDYFLGMFCGIGKGRKEFRIPGISGSCLGEILNYIYTDEVFVSEQNLADLMEAAVCLLLKDLYLEIKQRSMEYVTTRNCLRVYKIACRNNDEEISRSSFRIIETKFKEIMDAQTDDLAELPLESLEKILRSRSLNVNSETTVWLSIVEWTLKDVTARSQYVPQLFMCLAGKELEEDLAKEILKHQIVSENSFMKDLNELKDSPDFTSSSNAILQFQENLLSRFQPPLRHRIPSRLYVIVSNSNFGIADENDEYFKADSSSVCLYVTYDEHFDLWRKVGKIEDNIDHFHPWFLTVIGHSVYLFDDDNNMCKQFDLITQQWVPMAHFLNVYEFCGVVEHDGYIYIMGNNDFFFRPEEEGKIFMEMYDTANNRWFNCPSSVITTYDGAPVVINGKIYVVGHTDEDGGDMTAQMFDTVTRCWTVLPPPNTRKDSYQAVASHGKVYLLGAESIENIEVFDPEANYWELFPKYQHTLDLAIVLDDQIYVCSATSVFELSTLHWNEAEKLWEKSPATYPLTNNKVIVPFAPVEVVDTIRGLVKRNDIQEYN